MVVVSHHHCHLGWCLLQRECESSARLQQYVIIGCCQEIVDELCNYAKLKLLERILDSYNKIEAQ